MDAANSSTNFSLNRETYPDALQQLVARSLEMMACYGNDGSYLAVSPALAVALSCEPEALLGQTNAGLADLATQLNRSGGLQSYWQQVDDAVAVVLQQGQAQRRIHTLPTASGFRVYDTTYTPVEAASGEVQQVISISRESDHGRQSSGNGGASRFPQPMSEPTTWIEGAPRRNSAPSGVEMPELESASLVRPAVTLEQIAWSPPKSNQPSDSPSLEASTVHQTAEFMQLVLDNILQCIFWKDRNSVYLGCNRRWAEMAGIGDPSNVVGLTDDDLPWTAGQRDWYIECDRQVMGNDIPMLRIKQSQREADGRVSWRETSKLPLHDAEGNVVGLLGTIEDITERKITEDLMRKSREAFQRLAKQKDLLNQLSSQIRRSLKPEVIQRTTVHEIRRLLNTDRVVIYRFEDDWRGQVVVESVVSPWCSALGDVGADNCFAQAYAELYRQGRVKAIADVNTADIDTCHRDFLQRFQVQANLIVPILVQDGLWGLLITHQCSGPRQWQESEIELLQALAGQFGVAIQQGELHAQTKRSAALAKQRAEQLEVALQERKQAQAQLIQTEKMSSLGKMVAGIAHEINNPVTFIHGNLTYLKRYYSSLTQLLALYQDHYSEPSPAIAQKIQAMELDYLLEDLDSVLRSIEVGSMRIHQTVASLRNFSRLDESEKKAIDIHEGLESTLLLLQHHIKAKSNRAEIQIARAYGELPLVECYPSQLNQVFMNLLDNAVDALDQQLTEGECSPASKPPKIEIETQVQGDHAVVSIRDNGPGISQEHQAQLFEPFFTTKGAGKGTGLGLSISHQIITEKHGGRLTCSSIPPYGTEF
ncbi:MAG: ATP-binding protein, partial [Cyanobacteria bacterium P01_A01_bin.135]